MAKSSYARSVDDVQNALRAFLKGRGFTVRGRTFNRTTEDGLTQVVSIQMGASEPPGTTSIPERRETLHGLFTVNLGVYVPEVARHHGGGEARSWVQEYHCCVRARLGAASGEGRDLWWPARADDEIIGDICRRLELGGLPFLGRYSTRDKILAEWGDRSDNMGASHPPRIVMAIILAERNDKGPARELLARQARETTSPGHRAYVRKLADELSVGALAD